MLPRLVPFRLWLGPYFLIVLQSLRGYLYAFYMISVLYKARICPCWIHIYMARFGGFGGVEIGMPGSARFASAALEPG